MDLGLSEEQEMLKRTAREMLEAECPKTLVRDMEEDEKGYSPELWQKARGAGIHGPALPRKVRRRRVRVSRPDGARGRVWPGPGPGPLLLHRSRGWNGD